MIARLSAMPATCGGTAGRTTRRYVSGGKLPLRRKNNVKIRAMNKNLIEKIAPQLTELMIKKMETLTEEWRKPWIADLAHGLPRNLRGTPYRGGNILMLLFLSEIAGYSTPLFMTFKQAKEEGLNILKGSGSFPVFFWKLYIRHKALMLPMTTIL